MTLQVTFKTGTKVKIINSVSGFVSVVIIPSLHDIGQTEGLCQLLDGQKESNLILRDGTTTPCPDDYQTEHAGLKGFLTSWRYVIKPDISSTDYLS